MKAYMKLQYKKTKNIKGSGRGSFAQFNPPWNIYWEERALTCHKWRTNRPVLPMVVLEMLLTPLFL